MLLLSEVSSDLRFAFRMLRRNPAFSAVAILSLALGIGASSAMFSLIYALWVDPYPYRDADRLINRPMQRSTHRPPARLTRKFHPQINRRHPRQRPILSGP